MAVFDSAGKGYSLGAGGDRQEAEQVSGLRVSSDFFAALGVRPFLGREFLPEEDTAGRNRVVILSHGLWERRYGADRGIVGRPIRIDGENYLVVGVMPRGFQFQFWSDSRELWVPAGWTRGDHERDSNSFIAIARLKRGVTVATANAEIAGIHGQLARQYRGGPQRWRHRDAAVVLRSRRRPGHCDHLAGGGGVRAPDRLRQRRQPDARPWSGAPQGVRDQAGAGSVGQAAPEATARREPPPVCARWRRRTRGRVLGEQGADEDPAFRLCPPSAAAARRRHARRPGPGLHARGRLRHGGSLRYRAGARGRAGRSTAAARGRGPRVRERRQEPRSPRARRRRSRPGAGGARERGAHDQEHGPAARGRSRIRPEKRADAGDRAAAAEYVLRPARPPSVLPGDRGASRRDRRRAIGRRGSAPSASRQRRPRLPDRGTAGAGAGRGTRRLVHGRLPRVLPYAGRARYSEVGSSPFKTPLAARVSSSSTRRSRRGTGRTRTRSARGSPSRPGALLSG